MGRIELAFPMRLSDQSLHRLKEERSRSEWIAPPETRPAACGNEGKGETSAMGKENKA